MTPQTLKALSQQEAGGSRTSTVLTHAMPQQDQIGGEWWRNLFFSLHTDSSQWMFRDVPNLGMDWICESGQSSSRLDMKQQRKNTPGAHGIFSPQAVAPCDSATRYKKRIYMLNHKHHHWHNYNSPTRNPTLISTYLFMAHYGCQLLLAKAPALLDHAAAVTRWCWSLAVAGNRRLGTLQRTQWIQPQEGAS